MPRLAVASVYALSTFDRNPPSFSRGSTLRTAAAGVVCAG
jgi:hypothetical protein